jgi:hypothetical protein
VAQGAQCPDVVHAVVAAEAQWRYVVELGAVYPVRALGTEALLPGVITFFQDKVTGEAGIVADALAAQGSVAQSFNAMRVRTSEARAVA